MSGNIKRIYSASHGKYAVYENGKFVRFEAREKR